MEQKRIVIVGATSGIGREVARLFISAGWRVGIAGRREEQLQSLAAEAPGQVVWERIDITHTEAAMGLERLIERLGGMDHYFHASGIGAQNPMLDPEVELRILETNAVGFTRMITAAYRYLAAQGKGGHISAISSIAGTKGLGTATAYSATKRYQNTYIDALAQLAHLRKDRITFTDIRPGFVATALLNDSQNYPMLMQPEKVAQSIFRAILRRKRSVVIDWRYRLLVLVWRLIPRFVWERLPIRTKSK